jgi:uncharacterized metal-binding protein YceD (DUF177 family)
MTTPPEFSFFVNCNSLKEAEKTYQLKANADERAALGRRLDLSALDSLQVKAVVSRQSADLVALVCDCSVEYVQQCVVTFKPLKNQKNFSFERIFSATAREYFGSETEPGEEAGAGVSEVDDEAPEPPDPMSDGGFDVGECVAEQLSLEIDPFPRAADASFEGLPRPGETEDSTGRVSPFAVLEQLKKKL